MSWPVAWVCVSLITVNAKRWKECRRVVWQNTQNSNDFKFLPHRPNSLYRYLTKGDLKQKLWLRVRNDFFKRERAKHERFHHFLRIYAYTTARNICSFFTLFGSSTETQVWFLLTKFIDKFLLRWITVWSWNLKLFCDWLTWVGLSLAQVQDLKFIFLNA